MKIALCFSGKLDEWKSCADSVVQNVVGPLKPDIFLSTWDDEDYKHFSNYYKPKKINISNYEETKPAIKNLISDCSQDISPGLLPMLYNMHSCNRLYNSYSRSNKIKYDLIIRLRPDILVLEQIKKHEIVKGNVIDTLPEYLSKHPETIISLAYLDLTLYEPTKKCLELIRPHLAKNSIVAFDELTLEEYPGETIALIEEWGLSDYEIIRNPISPHQSYLRF